MSISSYVHLKTRLLDDDSAAALAETFKVLGDPTRVRILDALEFIEATEMQHCSTLAISPDDV